MRLTQNAAPKTGARTPRPEKTVLVIGGAGCDLSFPGPGQNVGAWWLAHGRSTGEYLLLPL